MPGTFNGINVASNALRMFQRALDTTGNNIANVNTAGYSRQTVGFSTNDPLAFYCNGWRTLGQGMTISSISRIRDGYLDSRARSSAGDLSKYDTVATGLGQIEDICSVSADQGISAALDNFFNAWSGLGSNPSDTSQKVQVLNAGQTLADRVRGAYSQLTQLEGSTAQQVQTTINRINELGKNIADLNEEIRKYASSGNSPNDLLDQRDQAVLELSGLADTSVQTFSDGSYAVYVAGFTLTDSGGARTFPSTPGAQPGTFTDGSITYTPSSGKLAGLYQVSARIVTEKSQLDALANNLRNQFNTLHRTGNNNAGIDFFNEGAVPPDATIQNGAATFDLSAAVKASSANVVTSATGLAGDGGLALAMSKLSETFTGMPGGKTFQSYYLDATDRLAHDIQYYKGHVDTQKAVDTQIKQQQQSVSGVSLDDEMADMMRFQRSYQAAAKTLTIMDQMTEDLIGMLRT